ncbi:LysR family transcriptional regulator [Paraburkholderia sp. BL21I4N1]|uniref:LysR family transcriptional regulator n=1 Tax=Paraburkholderia sp. BL21I4N1 TaxID=1938801 RepID=UPI000CFD5E62|nr:LysR family transcriptional regulator [Paraburkholderia sp. BL21I4N1]PQV50686.1 LysR family transcriptional regulator [Paraburkholderia sp. BL21I4N1]
MNLKQLEAFAAISSLRTTTAAAQRLGVSQSAVSRLLGQLEEDMGLSLFVREQGRLTPTREGDALLQDVETIVEAARCLERHAHQLRFAGTRRKLVRVMVPNTFAQFLLPAVVERFYETHRDAVLEVFAGNYDASERALLSREVDLAFVRLPTRLPGIATKWEFDGESVCVMPREHPLAGHANVGPADLDGVPLVLLWRQSTLRLDIDSAFRSARVKPNVVAEVHSVSVACAMAARGIGIAIVNRLIAESCNRQDFVMRPFVPTIRFSTAIAWLESEPLSGACDAFGACLARAVEELGRNAI